LNERGCKTCKEYRQTKKLKEQRKKMGISEFIQEAILSLKHNKIRSLLAGFGVAWGIFILILLLGTGKGFQEGILKLFGSFAKNSFWVYGGQVAENKTANTPFLKQVLFTVDDVENIKKRFTAIDAISPELNYNGPLLVNSQFNKGYFQLRGVWSDYFKVKNIKPVEGRLLNILDNMNNCRVALIGKQMADVLFPHSSPVNQFINIGGAFFKVVGVIQKGSLFMQGEQNMVYMPYNTFTDCFYKGLEFNAFMLTLVPSANAIDFQKTLTGYLARKYGFDSNDKSALYILNTEEQVQAFNKLFKGIDIFLWCIGLSLLLSGIVGISNIMLVIVKERTFEIGIRKAIGAKSGNILGMIISESVIVTSLAGVVGMVMGILFVWLLNWVVASFFTDAGTLFTKAGIDFPIIIFSLFLLVVTGILAGLFPAKKAAEIAPIEAIRYEGR
jgi:putative ABC transport system permease protein